MAWEGLPPEIEDVSNEMLLGILAQRVDQYREQAVSWYFQAETLRRMSMHRSQERTRQREVDQAIAQAKRALDGLRVTNDLIEEIRGEEESVPSNGTPLTLDNMEEQVTLAELIATSRHGDRTYTVPSREVNSEDAFEQRVKDGQDG